MLEPCSFRGARDYLVDFDWGSQSGVHGGWAVLASDHQAEARLVVPPLVRAQAWAVKVHQTRHWRRMRGCIRVNRLLQVQRSNSEVVVKSTLSISAVVAAIRAVTHDIDKNLPVTNIAALADALDASVAQPRFRTLLLGLFGAIALMLAAVGIFGVISYSVSRRTHELGIRMALGAQPGSVLSMILLETLVLTLTGVAFGVPCSAAAARLFTHLLFNVTPYDPITLALVPLVIIAVGTLASYIPARRAMKVDPLVALRHE